MNNILLSPPAAFLILLAGMLIITRLLSALSFKKKEGSGDGGNKSYACGEDAATNLVQPDYSQFFPFAFFFTILHVMTLMIATVPVIDLRSCAMAIFYVMGAVAALFILFRS